MILSCSFVRSLGQHEALQAVSRELMPSKKLFAFSDDIFIVAAPERLATVHRQVETALWDRSRIRINQGTTQMWNRAGVFPGCQHIVEAGRTNPTLCVPLDNFRRSLELCHLRRTNSGQNYSPATAILRSASLLVPKL